MVDGFLLVDKPAGWTSHDVVAKVRGLLPGRVKAGHAGSLDPMATGLLVVGLGRATRLLRFVQDLPKVYRATARFGVATDTLDAEGEVLEVRPMAVSEHQVREAIPALTGQIEQIPPMVSAVKVGGRKLYELARRGEEVDRAPRPVTVYRFDLEEFEPGDHPLATFRIECGKGTYVRTLADDLARRLGGRAHLTALRRLAIGSLAVADARAIDEIAGAVSTASLGGVVLEPVDGLRDLPEIRLGPDRADRVAHGGRLPVAESEAPGARSGHPVRMTDAHGRLLAVYRLDDHVGVPEVVLV